MPVPEPKDRKGGDQKKTLGDSAAVEEACSELEADIAELRAKYEQYFLGVERKPPTVEHGALKKKMNGLRNTFVRQTSTKFLVDAVQNKLLTYERLWTRTLQEIEAGTYRRDLFKLKLKNKDREQELAAKAAADKAAKEKAAKDKAAATKPEAQKPAGAPQIAPMAAASKGPQAPAAAVAGQLSDQKMKAIYDAYVMAKKRCNEDVSKLSYDSLSQTLRKQVPELMKAHNAKSVEFKVVIKDGKAILRALPKDT